MFVGLGSSISALVVASWLFGHAAPVVHGQAAPVAAPSASLTVQVPHPDTVLALDERVIPGSGPTREFATPMAVREQRRDVALTATWKPNGYTTMTRTKTLTLRTGEHLAVDLTRDDPGDRVKVIYVPTPNDVAAEMVFRAEDLSKAKGNEGDANSQKYLAELRKKATITER